MSNSFLPSSIKQFEACQKLGEQTFAQLSDEQLFWKANEETNSIANLVKHMGGNMLSRWTDFLTTDGEKAWRDRESEFDVEPGNRMEFLAIWEEGWGCLFKAIRSLTEEDLGKVVYIRTQQHTVIEALHRQLAHYASHVGQIIFIGKLLKGSAWESLSIPRGKSGEFNEKLFSGRT